MTSDEGSPVMRGERLRSVPHLAGVRLTVIQRRIMALTAAGLRTEQIQFELGLSNKTFKRDKARIYEKLGAMNGAHAVAIWLGREALGQLIEAAGGGRDGLPGRGRGDTRR